ncbi:MAG TPA: molybdopterin-dependent oxidoreductase [Gemmataceae bacterium]|nr:molybdopterin-dependent oxidoreductase [Gemmataceae bacterium]
MTDAERFLARHADLTRRFFLRAGAAWAVTSYALADARADSPPPELARAIEKLESYFTPPDEFQDVSRGKPLPHSIPEAKRREVGLTRDTWRLEVVADPEHPATLGKPLTKKDGTALDFEGLLKLGERHAVRFVKVMTCLNIGCPLGMGVWEGVPLRDIVWRTEPKENLRRVFYFGYHNDDPKQMFRSSLPVGRVLEDPHDWPPVILCYKLNGDWLSPARGGPVRVVVPEAYGFKSIKWLTRVVLTNLGYANDTYLDGNNDIDSPLKTFAATLQVPTDVKPDQPIPVTGYAQVGVSGLSKVQVWVSPAGKPWPADDPYFAKAPWIDAHVLGPPEKWGGKLPNVAIPAGTIGFTAETGRPLSWPMKLAKAHWAALLPGLAAGDYTLRCRTIDAKGHAQPMPRPFKKSGRAEIEVVKLTVKA